MVNKLYGCLFVLLIIFLLFTGCGGDQTRLKEVRVVVFYNTTLNQTEYQALKAGLERLVKEFAGKGNNFKANSMMEFYRIPNFPQRALKADTVIKLSEYPQDNLGLPRKMKNYIERNIHLTQASQELFEVFFNLKTEACGQADYVFFYSNMIQNGMEYNFYNCEDSMIVGQSLGKMIYNLRVAQRNLRPLVDKYGFKDESKKRQFTFINTAQDLSPRGDCVRTMRLWSEVQNFWKDFIPENARPGRWRADISYIPSDSLFSKF